MSHKLFSYINNGWTFSRQTLCVYINKAYRGWGRSGKTLEIKGRLCPSVPAIGLSFSMTPNQLPKSISPADCVLLESHKKIFQLHHGSPWLSPRPHGRAQTKENWSRKKTHHIQTCLSVSPTFCNANSGSSYQFSMGKRTKEIGCLLGSQARWRLISHLSVLSFPQFKNQLVMNFSGNFLNNVISLKTCVSTIRFAFQVWIRKLALSS